MKPVIGLAATMATGAIGAVAVPLAAFGVTAHADQVNWEAVAQCESGGNWSANTGNGAYGGLQIKESTWEANGGVGSPANATPAEQVAVADRILATQGPGAWPTCMSRMRDQQSTMPVGSVTHFMTFLVSRLEGGA